MLDVLIIGCGNIAGGFDAARDPGALPLTHAGAYTRHSGFRIAACVDPDRERREAFAARWNVATAVASLGDIGDARFDVISIASPTALHAAHLAEALTLKPRLIFCEKPVTPSVAETERLVTLAKDANVLLAINHTRRWAPDIVRLAAELRAGEHGTVRSAVGWYTKGVLNNGAHMIDLLAMLLGPVSVVVAGTPVHDFWPDDPTIPAMLDAGGVPVQLVGGDARDYALFELRIVTSTATITMEDGGQAWRIRRAAESAAFAGYRALDAGERTAGEYDAAMLAAADNIAGALTRGQTLASDGASALAAQRVCDAIRLSAGLAP